LSLALRTRGQEPANNVASAPLDDVYSDDISIPATDGYALAATLYLPRGAKHHAV